MTKKIARKAGDEDKVELVEERRLKAVEKLDHAGHYIYHV